MFRTLWVWYFARQKIQTLAFGGELESSSQREDWLDENYVGWDGGENVLNCSPSKFEREAKRKHFRKLGLFLGIDLQLRGRKNANGERKCTWYEAWDRRN